MVDSHDIEIRVRPMVRFFGLFDHYFMIIDGNEYHPIWYRHGQVLPLGFTTDAHVACRKRICDGCYNKLIQSIRAREDDRMAKFYPWLNCETISMGISVQAMSFLAIPFGGLALAGLWRLS